MTAKEFVEKWPESVLNTNCLHDLACLECGQRSYLRIEIAQVCRVTDDGFEGCGDSDWDFNSWCMCGECEAEGEVRHFHVDGLDALLAEMTKPVVISDNLLNDPAFAAKIGGAS